MSERDFIHDVLNPLTIVEGNINLMIRRWEKLSKEEIHESMGLLKTELERAFAIIAERKKQLES